MQEMFWNCNSYFYYQQQAFGVGAFEREDADIYAKDDMSQYDFELGGPKAKKPATNLLALPSSDVLEGFVRASNPDPVPKIFPPPVIPRDFNPIHRIGRSRFDVKPMTEVSSSWFIFSSPTLNNISFFKLRRNSKDWGVMLWTPISGRLFFGTFLKSRRRQVVKLQRSLSPLFRPPNRLLPKWWPKLWLRSAKECLPSNKKKPLPL